VIEARSPYRQLSKQRDCTRDANSRSRRSSLRGRPDLADAIARRVDEHHWAAQRHFAVGKATRPDTDLFPESDRQIGMPLLSVFRDWVENLPR
jgi:hypothetical protein